MPRYLLPCCNEQEPTGKLCHGKMVLSADGNQYRCLVCRAWCGSQIHPEHAVDNPPIA